MARAAGDAVTADCVPMRVDGSAAAVVRKRANFSGFLADSPFPERIH